MCSNFFVMPWFKQKKTVLIQSSATLQPSSAAQHAVLPRPSSFRNTSFVIYHLNRFLAIVVIAVCRCYRCESCDAPLGKIVPVSHLSPSTIIKSVIFRHFLYFQYTDYALQKCSLQFICWNSVLSRGLDKQRNCHLVLSCTLLFNCVLGQIFTIITLVLEKGRQEIQNL